MRARLSRYCSEPSPASPNPKLRAQCPCSEVSAKSEGDALASRGPLYVPWEFAVQSRVGRSWIVRDLANERERYSVARDVKRHEARPKDHEGVIEPDAGELR